METFRRNCLYFPPCFTLNMTKCHRRSVCRGSWGESGLFILLASQMFTHYPTELPQIGFKSDSEKRILKEEPIISQLQKVNHFLFFDWRCCPLALKRPENKMARQKDSPTNQTPTSGPEISSLFVFRFAACPQVSALSTLCLRWETLACRPDNCQLSHLIRMAGHDAMFFSQGFLVTVSLKWQLEFNCLMMSLLTPLSRFSRV